ncbi:MAG: hypothetical protein WDO69_00915 [Pseudomonadota bacterium]
MKPPLLAFGLVALSTAACSGAADIPDTPDLRALLASYERPTASLDVSNVTDALNSVPNLQELAAGIQAAKYIVGDVDYASRTPTTDTKNRVRLQGSLGLKIRCPGDATNPMYDENINGSLSLTLAVADNKILRGIGGHANACVLQGSLRGLPARIELDDSVAFDLGGDISLGQPWTGDLLASFPGELTVAGFTFQSVSGRLHAGRFQTLAQLPNGQTIVLEVGDDGITIRDATGVWFCAEGESCAQQP